RARASAHGRDRRDVGRREMPPRAPRGVPRPRALPGRRGGARRGHAARLRSALRRHAGRGRGEEPRLERAAVIDATRRIAWLAIATAGAAVLVLARMLEPDARGHGTHEQLGLPPCGFLELT